MRRALPAPLLAVVLIAGCGGGDQAARTLTGSTDRAKPPTTDRGGRVQPPPARDAGDERVIRGWNAALHAERYGLAADYFARPAIVEQAAVVRLPDRRAAIAFNRSLPCKSRVTDIQVGARSSVAAFALEPGPGGGRSCGGDARVRFVIEGGRIKEWRQLSGSAGPGGQVI